MSLTTRTELLTAYAAGETSPGLSLLCAAHLSMDAGGRAFVAMAETVAGAALRAEEPPAQAAMDWNALAARLDQDPGQLREERPCGAARSPDQGEVGQLPAVVRAAAGGDAASVPWRFRLPGISEHVLAGFGDEKVSLMRARPGARVPSHTHRGVEATLVLAGAMRDGEQVLTKGDIALCDDEHDHHPEIIGDEICYCLIVVDGGLRFTGTLGRALNLFADKRGWARRPS